METIVKYCSYVLIVFSVLFALFSISTAKKLSRTKVKSVPKVYGFIFDKLNGYEMFSYLLGYIESRFALITADLVLGRLYAVLLVTLYLPLFVLTFSFLNSYATTWYYTVLNLLCCGVFPMFFIKSISNRKCIAIRQDIMQSFMTLAALLNSNKLEVAYDRLIDSNVGNVKKIWEDFLDTYSTNRVEAYSNLQCLVGDSYTNTIVNNLVRFEEDGIDPASEILRIAERALVIYRLEVLKAKSLGGMRLVVGVCILFNLGLGVFGKMLAANLDLTHDGSILYVCLLMCFISYILSLFFEGR